MKQYVSVCGKYVNELFLFILLLTTTLPVDKVLPDSVIAPRWYTALFVACLWGVFALSRKKYSIDYSLCSFALLLVCAFQSSLYFAQTAGILQTCDGETVCFSNAAGLSSCLCFSIPALCYMVKSSGRPISTVSFCVLICCMLVVVCLRSRTGMVCLALLGFTLVCRKKLLIYGYVVSLLLLLPLCFWLLKPASTLGRRFVIQRTFDMILQHPLTGWGPHGFLANYMHVQADFFVRHPYCEYVQLADDMCHPLNEYLLIAVDYGLAGLLLIIIFAWYVAKHYINHKSVSGFVGMTTLVFIAVFSMFSYPLSYPFTWVVLIFSLCLIFRDNRNCIVNGVLAKLTVLILLFMGSLVVCVYQYGLKWERVKEKVNEGYRSGVRKQYEDLYPILQYNSRFLYNYTYALYMLRGYEESLKIAIECQRIHSDYNLSLLIGDIYLALGKDEMAIRQYLLAHHMCPCRFAPLCAIYDVYKQQCNYKKCKMMSKIILEKPIKIRSPETLEYIDYIKRDINELILKKQVKR